MAEYFTAKEIVIPAGTALVYPQPIQKEAVTYGSARFEAGAEDQSVCAHFQIPLDEAIKLGLVKEAE